MVRVACVAYAIAIFVASSFPAPSFVPAAGFSIDKVYHVVEFAILGALVTAAIGPAGARWPSRAPWLGFAVAGAYGVLDEIHQVFVPSRIGDPWDAVADLLGGAMGAILVWFVAPWRTFTHPSGRA